MKIRFLIFVSILSIHFLKGQSIPSKLIARWCIDSEREYVLLPSKILNALDAKTIPAYDVKGNPISLDSIYKSISLFEKTHIPEEPYDIEGMAMSMSLGDATPLQYAKSTFSLEEIIEMTKVYSPAVAKKIRKSLSIRTSPKDFNRMRIDLAEEIILDTTKLQQRGKYQYLVFKIDTLTSFRVNYEDFLKLNLTIETQALNAHKFQGSNRWNDLNLEYDNKVVSLMKEFDCNKKFSKKALNNSLFKYFKKDLVIYDASLNEIAW